MALTKPRAYQIYDIDYKQATRAVTVANVTLGGGAPAVVDGVNLIAGDRVLVTGQTDAKQNGIYVVSIVGSGSNGTWTRSDDTNSNGELLAGTIVMVTEGTGYADTQWKLITDNPIVIGTTELIFTQNYSANSISAGTSNVSVQSNANVTVSSAGTANVVTVSNTGAYVAGVVSATGNITASYIIGNGSQLTGLPAGYSNANVAAYLPTYTGNLTAGNISVTGNTTSGNLITTDTVSVGSIVMSGNLIVGAGPTLTIDPNGAGGTDGNVVITGNLTVQGTTTTINSNTVTTNDLQINMANNAANATAANNGGIGVGPAGAEYATLLYNTAANVWVSSLGISSVGNISANNLSANTVTGTLSTAAQPNITSVGTLTSLSSSGNITAGNLLISGAIIDSAQLDIQTSAANANIVLTPNGSGNVNTPANVSVTGNVQAGNVRTVGLITATGNITGNYFIGNGSQLTGIASGSGIRWTTSNTAPVSPAPGDFWYNGNSSVKYQYTNDGTSNVWVDQSFPTSFTTLAVTGNATIGGNLGVTGTLTYGNISTTGNVDGGNLRTSGVVTATGNITGGNILTAGLMSSTGNAIHGNILTAGLISATGNATAGNILTAGLISATGAITGGSATVGIGNITAGNLLISGAIIDSAQLDIQTTASNANIILTPNGTGNVNTGANVSITGNVQAGNVCTVGLISATGNVTGGNVITAGLISATGNINGGNLSVSTGTVTLGNIVNANGNGVGNIGSSSLYFNTIFAKATSAQYADLAEMYCADEAYEPGTVIEFGGVEEVTITTNSHSPAVAGIVSTNPSYLMNATLDCVNAVQVALTGRVPCRVIGTIHKGDRLVASDIAGVATVLDMNKYEPGCIIGKALENYNSNNIGVIEVAVGRT